MRQFFKHGTGHDSTLWPVLLLLLIVLVPSAGVMWMMRAAMENERLAVRQRLAEAYRVQLDVARRSIEHRWHTTLKRLDAIAARELPEQAFAECVGGGAVDSVIILDASGNVAYPAAAAVGTAGGESSVAWTNAEYLEFGKKDPAAAAEAYGAVAAAATDASAAARARQAQARALVRAGDRDAAIQVLQLLCEDAAATDAHGRLLAADAELRLLELLDPKSDLWQHVAAKLAQQLNDYVAKPLPADQRRFLMHALRSLDPNIELRTLAAEDLAVEFLAASPEPVSSDVLQPTKLANVSQLRSTSGRVIALLKEPTFRDSMTGALAEQLFPEGIVVEARGPGQPESAASDLVTVSLGPQFLGWRLALRPADAGSFDTAANERTAFFLWTGIVVVAITAALALLVARMLREQSRLTRLKNDLVATVSHELKTPLASIRLLVDTLLDADGTSDAPFGDHVRAREYLEMIAKENTRLSRLIDNFLTFSRMERGKHRFEFLPTDGAAIVDEAVAAVAERFDGVTNKLCVEIERPLPLEGDTGALVTVVVNLLDNAWKYSDEPKQVTVAAHQSAGRVVISVTDNGIGLSPRAARKVFDRFYQVDQHLSRSHDGCGLGLSIVKYIVEAHGGEVSAASRLGAGTTFTVSLPASGTT
jgi:two-component system, OmpR family, phosphate regulon sensor histidine kinase PhoR